MLLCRVRWAFSPGHAPSQVMTVCLPEGSPAVHIICCLTAAPVHGGIVQLPEKLRVCLHSSFQVFFHIISLWDSFLWLLFYPGNVTCLNCPWNSFSVHMISEIPISSSKAWCKAGTSCSCLRRTTLCNHVVILIAVSFWLTGTSLSQGIYHQLRWLPVICFSEFEN